MQTELIPAVALVVGYFMRPVSEWIGLAIRHQRADVDRRRDFQFETLSKLSQQLESWRYGTDKMTVDAAKAQVEIHAFKVRDDRLRSLVESMLAADHGSETFNASYGNAVRQLGTVQREL
jgi:hypothetical protein